jgi:hypothetical protein
VYESNTCVPSSARRARQEQLAVQLISEFGRIWKEENCPGWVYYFRIMVTSENLTMQERSAQFGRWPNGDAARIRAVLAV